MAAKIRKLKLTEGTVTTFRLTDVEWLAIEQSAQAHGMEWPDWARMLIDANPTAPNRAGLLRRAALEEAMGSALMVERAEMMASGEGGFKHPMLADRFAFLDNEGVEAEMDGFVVAHKFDCVAFELIAGYRDASVSPNGGAALIVRSKLEDGMSVVLTADAMDY